MFYLDTFKSAASVLYSFDYINDINDYFSSVRQRNSSRIVIEMQ